MPEEIKRLRAVKDILVHLYSNKTLLMYSCENGGNSFNSVEYIVTRGDNAILLSGISV